MKHTIKTSLANLIRETINDEIKKGNFCLKNVPSIGIEYPRLKEHGDFSTTVAFQLAKEAKAPPREIAERIAESISARNSNLIDKIEIAGGGYINFWIKPAKFQDIIIDIQRDGENFATSNIGEGRKVLFEFVSANPTGPLHIGHGRGAVYGDVLARIYSKCGFEVEREYYVNNIGNQIAQLGLSLKARYLQILGEEAAFPEDGYRGDYVVEIAQDLYAKEKDTWKNAELERFSDYAVDYILKEIDKVLKDFRVNFDHLVFESQLHKDGYVEKVIDFLNSKQYTYFKDNALFLKTSEFFDEKDRVLRKEDKSPTYFVGDIAYHNYKSSRKYHLYVNIWGADHHGYVNRMFSAWKALGNETESLKILLYQLVNLIRHKEIISMSTRKGEFVTLEEVIREVGVDVTRFFMLMRSHDSPLDFDLDLAKKQSNENPVYYVQYVHARCCSILKKAKSENYAKVSPDTARLGLLNLPEELELLKKMAVLPDEIVLAAQNFEPHRLTNYLIEISKIFHNYYNHHRVISDEVELTKARLLLVDSIRIVVKIVLGLLGVSCPERM